jgi:predicted transport protein
MDNPSVEEIIHMREKAIQGLLEEKDRLQGQLEEVLKQIEELDINLQRLGYLGALQPNSAKSPKRNASKPSEIYTIEMLLDGKDPDTISLFHSLSEKITSLESGIKISPFKKYVAFCTKRNFCEVVVWVSKLTIYLDIPLSNLDDPEKIAEDCSTIGHWATGETRLQLFRGEDMEYALNLINQSYQYNSSS